MVKISLFQMNSVLGDLQGNAAKIIDYCKSHSDTDIVMTPELSLCGYPPEDLIFHKSFLCQCKKALDHIVQSSFDFSNVYLIVGLPYEEDGKVFNVAALIKDGKVLKIYKKHNLPTYGVFDESRYFAAGSLDAPAVFQVKGTTFGINVCEDIWHPDAPLAAKNSGTQVLLIINASPYERNKQNLRTVCAQENVCDAGMDIVYVNAVGSQDEITFDGNSFTLTREGKGHCLLGFSEDSYTVQVENGHLLESASFKYEDKLSELYSALVLSFRQYVQNNGFKGVVLGLSGGIDSALVLKIAVDAVGADKVEAVMMPSQYTSSMSLTDAQELASRLKVKYSVIPIKPIFDVFEASLAEEFKGMPEDVTEENLQARIRAVLLMAISNKKNLLLATTGNKSELAVGYSTLYGDLAGGFAIIKDIFKTEVYELCRWINSVSPSEVFPQNILTRAPSAELREDQKDQESLPEYSVLDGILKLYIEKKMSVRQIVEEGYDEEIVKKVISLVKRAEYKRRQGPIGPKMSDVAFGRDWRYPVTNKFRE